MTPPPAPALVEREKKIVEETLQMLSDRVAAAEAANRHLLKRLDSEQSDRQNERAGFTEHKNALSNELEEARAKLELYTRSVSRPQRYSSLTPALLKINASLVQPPPPAAPTSKHSTLSAALPSANKPNMSLDATTYDSDVTRLRSLNTQLTHRVFAQEKLINSVLSKGLGGPERKPTRGRRPSRPSMSGMTIASSKRNTTGTLSNSAYTSRPLDATASTVTSMGFANKTSSSNHSHTSFYSPQPLLATAAQRRPSAPVVAPIPPTPGQAEEEVPVQQGRPNFRASASDIPALLAALQAKSDELERLSREHTEALQLLTEVTTEARSQHVIIQELMERVKDTESVGDTPGAAEPLRDVRDGEAPTLQQYRYALDMIEQLRLERNAALSAAAEERSSLALHAEALTHVIGALAKETATRRVEKAATGHAGGEYILPPRGRPYMSHTPMGDDTRERLLGMD
jgi:hypothetical protein